MRALPLLASSLLLLSSSAFAQTLDATQPGTDPVSTVQVRAPVKTVWLSDNAAREIAGHYSMSNGWQMKVRPAARHIDASVDGEKPMRLLHVARDTFVSADGDVSMQFNQGEAGDEMTMRYVPDRRLGQVVVISSRLAQR